MKCPRCQHENPPGMRFCGQCAAPLAAMCSSCGAMMASESTVMVGVVVISSLLERLAIHCSRFRLGGGSGIVPRVRCLGAIEHPMDARACPVLRHQLFDRLEEVHVPAGQGVDARELGIGGPGGEPVMPPKCHPRRTGTDISSGPCAEKSDASTCAECMASRSTSIQS
jgi:Double zinc ribbon